MKGEKEGSGKQCPTHFTVFLRVKCLVRFKRRSKKYRKTSFQKIDDKSKYYTSKLVMRAFPL